VARYASGLRTGAGSTTLPQFSVYSAAAVGFALRECGIFNTTTTATAEKLTRLTNATGVGAGQVEAKYDDTSNAAQATAFTTHGSNPGLGDDLGYRTTCGAAAGAGPIWTFPATGIHCPVGTANGVGVIVATGTGQVLDAYMVWDE
jgi:hypothetical protein